MSLPDHLRSGRMQGWKAIGYVRSEPKKDLISDTRYCCNHYERHQRHGNPFKSSYKAKELNPYRQAALLWLLEHEDDRWAQHAIGKVRGLYRRAGQHVETFRLRGMQPRERAWAHWARAMETEETYDQPLLS